MSQTEEETLLKVEIFDTFASSTILKILPTTTTAQVCEAIAYKTDLSTEQIKYYNLILLISWLKQGNKGSNGTTSKSNPEPATYSYVRTLKPDEIVLSVFHQVLEKIERKRETDKLNPRPKTSFNLASSISLASIYDINNNSMTNDNVSIRWFYKDMRTTPLDCTTQKDDISANSSSSEDEKDISTQDFTYLNQFERKGYLLRRSRKDPNIWRKRLCVLVDNLWCIDYPDPKISITRRKQPKAQKLPIGRHFKVYDSVQGFDYPHCIALQLQSTGSEQNIVFLRAPSQAEQQLWVTEIIKRSNINAENQVISMGEIIICDETKVQGDKLIKDVITPIESLFKYPSNESTNVVIDRTSSFNAALASALLGNDISIDDDRKSMDISHGPSMYEHRSDSDSKAVDVSDMDYMTISDINTSYDKELSVQNIKTNLYSEIERSDGRLKDYSLDSQMSLPYSVETLRTLNLRTHRSPAYSRIHELHMNDPVLSDCLMFLADVNRYKQLRYRWELLPTNIANSRLLWVKILIIYQKYLQRQINILYPSSKDYQTERNHSKEGQRDRKGDKRLISEAIETSVPPNSPRKHRTTYRLSDNSISKTTTSYDYSWGISYSIFVKVQKRIFSNIRRQIAGFDVPSMKIQDTTYDADDDDNEDELFDSNGRESQASGKYRRSGYGSQSNASFSTPVSNPSGMFGWLWGAGTNNEEMIGTGESMKSKSKPLVLSDQYIRYDEIYESQESRSHLARDPSMNGHRNHTNQPIYQIKDLDDLPSPGIFDEIVDEINALLLAYTPHDIENSSIEGITMKRSQTI